MDKNDLSQHKKLLNCLSSFPKQILSIQTLDNVPEFVLHGLCNKDCFNLSRAAYFVDNPDFDCLKGIAGFSSDESDLNWDDIWQKPEDFKSLSFNKKVRNFETKSIKRKNYSYDDLIGKISKEIGFEKPSYCSWDMKHYNHGLLVYENGEDRSGLFDEHFKNSLYFLSFCPIVV